MNDSFLNSANAPYVAELFFKFKEDPNSIDKSWSNFFETFHEYTDIENSEKIMRFLNCKEIYKHKIFFLQKNASHPRLGRVLE